MPKASACFLALSLKSAMLEFLLWAAANAARLSGYWPIANRPFAEFRFPAPLAADVALQFELFMAAAYCKDYIIGNILLVN